MNALIRFVNDEDGATAIEYGLIAALISIAALLAIKGSGSKLSTVFVNISTNIR
jgi:pilus assembly protein Flp/PilA